MPADAREQRGKFWRVLRANAAWLDGKQDLNQFWHAR